MNVLDIALLQDENNVLIVAWSACVCFFLVALLVQTLITQLNPSLCCNSVTHTLDLSKIWTSYSVVINVDIQVISQIRQNPAKLGSGL